MLILGVDSLGVQEIVVCAIFAAFCFNERIETGLRALWRRFEG